MTMKACNFFEKIIILGKCVKSLLQYFITVFSTIFPCQKIKNNNSTEKSGHYLGTYGRTAIVPNTPSVSVTCGIILDLFNTSIVPMKGADTPIYNSIQARSQVPLSLQNMAPMQINLKRSKPFSVLINYGRDTTQLSPLYWAH